MREVILAGFDGSNNSARMIVERVSSDCRKLILPNDKQRSAELLLGEIKREFTACVVILGQRPRICDKIAVEAQARHGCEILRTNLDVTSAVELIKAHGYCAYISRGCGNSYCSHIYAEALASGVNCIFLHVPCLANISDMSAVCGAVEGFVNGLAGIPALLAP